MTQDDPDSPYLVDELENLRKYEEYMNDIAVRAEMGCLFPETLPYDENLL